MPPSLKAAAMAISAASSGEAVKVVVRCRPMNKQEKIDDRKKIVKVEPDKGMVSITDPATDEPKTFTFDACYDWDCKQRDVYDETAHPLIEEVLNGFNGTIFAYGQTGCGKSFTMMGMPEPAEMRGIIPNAFVHIFNHISVTKDKEFLIRASFIEIYNEEVRDLLGKDPEKKLDLKEDPDKGVYVKDLTAVVVKDYEEIDEVMKLGNTHRTVGATAMNADSSRSHSLFTVVIEMSEPVVNPENGETETKIKAGKLNLVDLAGSERQSKTQAEGARLKEATKINLSLSALGNVITAIASGKKGHIPYRDSKLTRLLQSSLGGNTKTVMCANIGPADYNYDETMSTLRYANRAKNIKNKPKINEDPKDALLRQFQEEIARLQTMLEGGGGGGGGGGGEGVPHGAMDMEQLQRMKAETEKAETEKQEMMALLEKERAEREAIDAQLAALKAKLVGGAAPGDVTAALLEGPVSPAKQDEATLAAPATPAAVEQSQGAANADLTPAQSKRQIEVHEAQRAEAKAEEQLYIDDEKFASLQEEVEEKTRKLEKLRKKLKSSQKEVQDLQSEFQVERDDFLETIRGAERELKLFTAIAKRHVSSDLLAMYEEQSTWDDDTEEWILPKAPKGMEMAGGGSAGGGRSKSGGSKSKQRKKAAAADMPPSDIGKASPTSAEDAEYANDIMGGSDEEYGRSSRSGSSSAGSAMNRSGGPREFDDADAEGGKYFTDAADRDRNNAGRRVLADATAMKNEMLSNLVLWGAEDVKLPGAKKKKKGSDLPTRRAPHQIGGLPLNSTAALPMPNIAGKANTFVDVLADQRAESAVAKDMLRFNQQQALGRPKPMSDADELAFVKELAGGTGGAGGGGGKMTL